jgi:hypothetical protein
MILEQGWRRIKIIGGEYMSVLDVENPCIGNAVQCRPGVNSIIRLPRKESLRILPKSGMSKMYDALVSCELLSRTPLSRGDARRIFGDRGRPMYSSIGAQVSRFGGVLERSPQYASLSEEHWRTLIKMTRRAECALESFADASVLRQLNAAKALVDFNTLSSNNTSVKYFGAIAFGRNVFLRCHTDEDFTFSVTQVFLKGSDCYAATDRVVAFFCFPTLGIAVPMRPGDFILFNASLPHSISSRCHSSDDIMCVSYYLKSMVVGMNDNGIPLSPDQIYLSKMYDDIDRSL